MYPLLELHPLVRSWSEAGLRLPSPMTDRHATLGYIDLMFAFGLAEQGEATAVEALVESAHRVLTGFKPGEDRAITAEFLLRAFKYRIDQALAGRSRSGRLSQELLDELEQIRGNSVTAIVSPHMLAHFAIQRMRECSRILEPLEWIDQYAEWMRHGDALRSELHALHRHTDPHQLADRIRELYRDGVDGRPTAKSRLAVLHEALPLAARVGEPFTLELVALVPEVLASCGATGISFHESDRQQKQLLERALYLAAYFNLREVVRPIVNLLIDLTQGGSEVQRYGLINAVAGQCFQSLHKLGLTDELGDFLRCLQSTLADPQTLRERPRADRDALGAWAQVLQAHTRLAGALLLLGQSERAAPVLKAARIELLGSDPVPLSAKDYVSLAQAYIGALCQGSIVAGLPQIVELFRMMPPERVINSFTTSKFYSRFHLALTEEAVLAVGRGGPPAPVVVGPRPGC